MQPNLPCTDNVAFDMERLTRTQAVNRRSALGDLASDNSLGLEPLRTSGISPLPQDGELTPRTGEINIAVTSKWGPVPGCRADLLLFGVRWLLWRTVEAISWACWLVCNRERNRYLEGQNFVYNKELVYLCIINGNRFHLTSSFSEVCLSSRFQNGCLADGQFQGSCWDVTSGVTLGVLCDREHQCSLVPRLQAAEWNTSADLNTQMNHSRATWAGCRLLYFTLSMTFGVLALTPLVSWYMRWEKSQRVICL